MIRLFSPVAAVMDRLRYPYKFSLISLLFAMPLTLLMYGFISEFDDRIEFSRKEIYGDQYLRPLRRLLEDLTESRRLAGNYAGRNAALRAEMAEKQAGIDRDFKRLANEDQSLGAVLETSDRFIHLFEDWQILRENYDGKMVANDSTSANIDVQHAKLIGEVYSLISHVGDKSNLILDPDLDSYYLMDAVLLKLPRCFDLLAQFRSYAENPETFKNEAGAENERAEFMALTTLLKANLNETKKAFDVAFRSNVADSLKPNLERGLHQYVEAIEALLAVDREKMDANSIENADGSASAALGNAFQLWDATVVQLDRLLAQRVDRFVRRKFMVITFTLVMLVVVVYMWLGFYESVMRTVTALESASQRMSGGDFSEVVPVGSNDELGGVTRSFNTIACRLREEWTQAREEKARAVAAEGLLRMSTASVRMIIDTAQDAIITMNHLGRILDYNSAAERIFGYRRDDALGQCLSELIIPPAHREAHCQGLERFRATGESRVVGKRIEISALRSDGAEFPIELSINVIPQEGPPVFFAYLRDITERKRAELELRDAKEAAEAANRAKSEFLANMSHEIRTPMNGIIGMTELSLDAEVRPEQRETLEMIRLCADSLLGILNDILDFSKIEARKLDLDQIPFDLSAVLDETMRLLAPRAHQKGLELAYHVAPDVPCGLEGDPARLRQILVNLIGNSLKFTEAGEVVLQVQRADEDTHRLTIQFTVTDTGIGIRQDKQAAIFECFTQADASTTRRYGGTGLGLTISSQLVSLMGGRIWVESEVGVGSSFHFTLPFDVPDEVLAPAPSRELDDLGGIDVLVVDDNATNRRILEKVLTNWGMRPTMVDGGPAALRTMELACESGHPFAIALVDYQMPEMDGFELAKRIKQRPELAGTTIMMLSSIAQGGNASLCHELGVAAYLTKPVRQSVLLEAMLLLGRPNRPPEPAAIAARETVGNTLRPLRVLLAEDNPVNRLVAVRMLEKRGHTVETAEDGQSAVAAAARQSFDVALMDVQMRGMDGLEATAEIRRREIGTDQHLPIVALTAHAMREDEQRCLDAGMDAYLSKPFKAGELFQLLATVLPDAATPAIDARVSDTRESPEQTVEALNV